MGGGGQINALNVGIYSTLSAGTALTALLGGTHIYHMQAPDNLDLPYVVYSWQGGGRTGEVRYLTNQLEFVRAYGTSAVQAGSIHEACSDLLDHVAISVSGWTVCQLMREDDFESVETLPNGELVYSMGAFYRVMLDR